MRPRFSLGVVAALASSWWRPAISPCHGAGCPKRHDGWSEYVERRTAYLWRQAERCFHDGDYRGAIRYQCRVARLDPHDIEAYTVSAWLTWSMGDNDGAAAWLQACVRANPRSWRARFEMGMHLYRVHDYAGSVDWLRQASRLGMPPIESHMLAHALQRAGDVQGALAVWEDLLRQAPGDAVVRRNRDRLKSLVQRQDKDVR